MVKQIQNPENQSFNICIDILHSHGYFVYGRQKLNFTLIIHILIVQGICPMGIITSNMQVTSHKISSKQQFQDRPG